jgi:uroporphyrin-III C-methyltransferase
MSRDPVGKVFLVGAGPGNPKLLTLRAVELLGIADVILVDRLVDRAALGHARAGARIIDVGKQAGNHRVRQEEINGLLVAYARRGLTVVRLKGGDPFVFGRGGEEALALADDGIPFEIVPGVSAGIAAAAYAGIPVTHRGVASSVTFRTAHRADGATEDDGTLVLFMCGATLADTARTLVAEGRAPSTPVAIVCAGTRGDQDVLIGTIADLLEGPPVDVASPALTIVGDVVALEAKLQWFGARRARPIRELAAAE